MIKLVLSIACLAGFALQALAHDFQSGNLLYIIISANPPCVSVAGRVDSENAQGELVIPETVDYEGGTNTVTEIGPLAFRRCSGLTGSLAILETIKIIDEQALYDCPSLTGLVMHQGSLKVREFAFRNCTGLMEMLDFPSTVTRAKYGAYANCAGFSGDLVLPNSVVEVGNTIYSGYLSMPEPVSTFADCFDHLVFSQALDAIGPHCFEGCTRLTGDLVMPEGLKAIYAYAFKGCFGLTGLALNDSLSIISKGAFSYCIGISGTLTLQIDGELVFKYGDKDCDEVYQEYHDGIEADGHSTGPGSVVIYPNPTEGVLVVEAHGRASQPDQTYRITNLMDQNVLTGGINAENQQVDVTGLPQGTYFIGIGEATQKFVVEK